MSDKLENLILIAISLIVFCIFAYQFKSIPDIEEMTSLTRHDFEIIYQDSDLSSCLWVNDPILQKSKESIAPAEIISNAMTEKCELAKAFFSLNRSMSKDINPTNEDLIHYIDTFPWMFRYKLVFPDWEKHLDSQLLDAMNTW